MKKLYSLCAIMAFSALSFAQAPIVSWNFDNESLTPNLGTGTITLVGGTTSSYVGGQPSTGKALNVATFPDQSNSSGTAGVEITVNTLNKNNIGLNFDTRSSNTASKWYQYSYSSNNGDTWNIISDNGGAQTSNFAGVSVLLPAAANNVENLKIRIVSIFAPGTSNYVAVGATATYGSGGTYRIDNLVINENQTASVKQDNIAGLSIYPNPANTVVNISSDLNVIKNVEIYDVLGKQVIKTATEMSVNVASLTAGVYMVKITQDGKSATRKLVIK